VSGVGGNESGDYDVGGYWCRGGFGDASRTGWRTGCGGLIEMVGESWVMEE
jgi:hypothetical protein